MSLTEEEREFIGQLTDNHELIVAIEIIRRLTEANERLEAKCEQAAWVPLKERMPPPDSIEEFAERGLSSSVELWDNANNLWTGFYNYQESRWWIHQGTEDDEPLPEIYEITYWRTILGPNANPGAALLEGLKALQAQVKEEKAACREMADLAVNAIDRIWAAIGDALCSGKGIEKAYAHAVLKDIDLAKRTITEANLGGSGLKELTVLRGRNAELEAVRDAAELALNLSSVSGDEALREALTACPKAKEG